MDEPKIDDAELERQIDEMDGITSEFDRARPRPKVQRLRTV